MISSAARPTMCSQTANSEPLLPGLPMDDSFIPSPSPRPTRTTPISGPSKSTARGNQTGGQPVRLTSGPDGKMRASLSADGKRLTFLRWTESPAIYVSAWSREAAAWLCSALKS